MTRTDTHPTTSEVTMNAPIRSTVYCPCGSGEAVFVETTPALRHRDGLVWMVG